MVIEKDCPEVGRVPVISTYNVPSFSERSKVMAVRLIRGSHFWMAEYQAAMICRRSAGLCGLSIIAASSEP